MSSLLQRTFTVLEHLAQHPEGVALSAVAAMAGMPLSASHRLLTMLVESGYVRQDQTRGDYVLTIKLVSMALGFLSVSGIVDVSQPLLDELSAVSGELVRLAVVDGDSLTFVAKAQGARFGLRYDPDMGLSVKLSCSAAGHAWLSTLSEERATELVLKQGFGRPADFGPRAPTTLKALMPHIRTARSRGFSTISEVFLPAMSAMAAPVRKGDGATIGVVTIAGPLVRLTEARMQSLAPRLMETARQVALASGASAMFKPRS